MSDDRAHGVTPGLRDDYARRTAGHQAAFVLPHLRPGMSLLDVGCGPGSITLGLAAAVAPAQVVGIDHDPPHVEAAQQRARDAGATNVSFRTGDALALPFDDGAFGAAFENNMLTHLGADAERAAREVYRVLAPGGLFAARDVDTSAVVWGHPSDALARIDQLIGQWMESNGSEPTIGRRLSSILRAAGFTDLVKSVSADTKGTPEQVRDHAAITVKLLNGPLGGAALSHGWADEATIARLKDEIVQWSEHPDAFFANVHVEVIGFKPA